MRIPIVREKRTSPPRKNPLGRDQNIPGQGQLFMWTVFADAAEQTEFRNDIYDYDRFLMEKSQARRMPLNRQRKQKFPLIPKKISYRFVNRITNKLY